MKNRLQFLLFFFIIGIKASAQAPGSLYLKTINSILPGSPESGQMMKYQDYPVNLFTGTPEISVPFYTLTGKGISVPIGISYNAGGGVKVDEQATNVGLNWALMAGGEITRDQRGQPDEGGANSSGYINKPWTAARYVDSLIVNAGTYDNFSTWVHAMKGEFDLEPDIFYFSVPGHSGKFVYDDSLLQFVCITDNEHLIINFDHSTATSFFTVITDDGNKYIFNNREMSATQAINKGSSGGSSTTSPSVITAWKLSKIINADATDSIMFNYDGEYYSYYTVGANTVYVTDQQGTTRNPVISYNYCTISGEGKLSSIKGRDFSVFFQDETADRLDLPAGSKALSKIIIKNNDGVVENIFTLQHSYFIRNAEVNSQLLPITIGNSILQKSLRLDGVNEYGNSETNTPMTHSFTYNSDNYLPARLDFAKDWWGYANSNDYQYSLVPPHLDLNEQPQVGANRQPDTSMIMAGLLQGITLPTGGTVSYQYEPNSTTQPVPYSLPDGAHVLSHSEGFNVFITTGGFYGPYVDSFIINQTANPTNNNDAGATVTISEHPVASSASSAIPTYYLAKYAEVDGTPVSGNLATFSRQDQTHGVAEGIHLPNGRYRMFINTNNYNQNLDWPPSGEGNNHILNMYYTVTYQTIDPNASFTNYNLAGVRVKTITTKDQYSNVTNTRRFIYNDPATGMSYGKFIGTTLNYWDEATGQSSVGGGQWRCFQGSYNMPGMGNGMASVIYPKVIEDETNNGITYRTEHYFTEGQPLYPDFTTSLSFGWPFTPANDLECGRGNEYKTIWDRYTTTGFVPAKMKVQNFDYMPATFADASKHFQRQIYGLKCAMTTYEADAGFSQAGYAPEFVASYQINVNNRLYMVSDSTITYDLKNQNNGITDWHDYTYGDYNLKPIVTRSGNSDASINIEKNYYVADNPDVNSEVSAILSSQPLSSQALSTQLLSTNHVSEPLGNKQFKDGQLLSQQYTYQHFDGNQLLVDSTRQALFSNPLDIEVKVDQYDNFGNPVLIELRGNKYRKYIWNTEKNLPLATCVTPANNLFFFSSFEYSNDGGTTGNAFSGTQAFQLNASHSVSIPSNVPIYNEDVFVWATSSDVYVNGTAVTSTGKVKGNWTLYKCHVTGNNSTISSPLPLQVSGTALIDQLVVMPAGSQFQGNVYDNLNRVIATVNDQILTSFYEYDNFGRLTIIRDEQGNILKSTTYQYQAAQ